MFARWFSKVDLLGVRHPRIATDYAICLAGAGAQDGLNIGAASALAHLNLNSPAPPQRTSP
jgi:hypothetical protein